MTDGPPEPLTNPRLAVDNISVLGERCRRASTRCPSDPWGSARKGPADRRSPVGGKVDTREATPH
ncbi:MAG: hypothetical protein JWO38_7479, partial [Gemmataceae bacterium]|nr:hypothetical protein [Gemmataceae bacterium]